ncbi:MAG: glycoside hydrolase family 172 protein [Fimbriimonas sp.]
MLSLPRPVSSHQFTTFNPETRGKTIAVPVGERVTVGEVEGTGYIAKLWMTFPGWFWQHWAPDWPVDQSILKTLILRIYFDGAEEPQVAAPVGDFFGIGLCEVASFTSEFIGMSSGGFYCSFPMPFRRSFRIEVENLDARIRTEVFFNVLYQRVDALPDDTPYFHAQFNTGANPGPEVLPIAEAEGRGKFVGCTLSCQGETANYLSFLEAPEYVYVDDDWDAPRIVGTGLEDYFLGGWYFREGTFAGPHHGVPVKDALRASVAMYRIHDLDAIYFDRRLKFTFQNPWKPERLLPFKFSSVGFLYLDRPSPVPAIPSREDLLLWYRVRDCDHQSIP